VITEKLIFKIPYEIADVPDYDVIFGANYFDHWDFNNAGSLTLTGTLIDEARSLTGSGRDFFSSGTQRPSIITDATIGRNVAEFDGVSENMFVFGSGTSYDFLHNGDGGCVIVVYKSNTTPAIQSQLVTNSFGDIGFRIQHVGNINSVVRNASTNIIVNATTESTPNGDYASSVTVLDAGNATLVDRAEQVTNGVSAKNNTTSGTPTLLQASNDLRIARRANAGSFYLDGTISEVIIADTIPTPTQLAQVQARLEFDYGTFPIT